MRGDKMTDYEKLQMTADKNEGSFVRNLQGQTGTGFEKNTHIHKDWYATTIDYDEALDQAQRAVDEREDILAPVKDVQGSVNEDGNFVFNVAGREFQPTDHAIEQFSIRVKVPSSSVMRELRNQDDYDAQDADVMTYLANNALRRLDQEKVYRLRTYTDGTCRAFVTDKYAPIDNRWYLETLQEFLPEGRLSHWKGDEDTIFGNVLLPDTIMDYGTDDDSDYGGMISIGNCEIGKRRISQVPSLFRSICLNGCIWGQVSGKQIKRRHIGTIDLDALKLEIGQNIEHQLPLLPNGITKFLAMRELENGDVSMKNIIAAICKDERLGKKEAVVVLDQYAQFENQERNLFGVVNAITRAGQKFDNTTWVKFDELGGNLMETDASRWAAILKRADSLQDKDFEKIFAAAV
jgi:hypothetical protein